MAFETKSLKSLGSKIWNIMPYHMNAAETLNSFKDLNKK